MDNLANQNSTYLLQQHQRILNFHPVSSDCIQETMDKRGDLKSNININICTNSTAIQYSQVPSNDQFEHYDQSNKRLKGRTGWPQHVIKNVWASELQESSQS